ncbi:MAG: flagellar biosynthetic protein FliO [Brevibacillus sp.]|nr:flagellar biosynthetic protein FliO [Brevibacillus sp.]
MFLRCVWRLSRIVCAVLILLGTFPYAGHAEDGETSVYDALQQQADKPAGQPADSGDSKANAEGSVPLPGEEPPSGWMLLLQVLFSLGLVVLLLILLLRFLASRQFGGLSQNGPLKVVGTVSLGSGKSVSLVMIGDSLYVLGVGEDVRLLRHIPAGDELDVILAEAEMRPTADSLLGGWLSQLRGQRQQNPVSQLDPGDDFGELLRKQWEEVNRPGRHDGPAIEDEERSRGEKT